jgi:hypothetical protein
MTASETRVWRVGPGPRRGGIHAVRHLVGTTALGRPLSGRVPPNPRRSCIHAARHLVGTTALGRPLSGPRAPEPLLSLAPERGFFVARMLCTRKGWGLRAPNPRRGGIHAARLLVGTTALGRPLSGPKAPEPLLSLAPERGFFARMLCRRKRVGAHAPDKFQFVATLKVGMPPFDR